MTIPRQKRNHNLLPGANLQLCRTLVFVGLMGAGKTTIGKRIAQRLNVPFFDSDHEVEAAAGMSVSDIFFRHGESAFRDTERKVIKRLLEGPLSIIATGGGAYMQVQTRETIRQQGVAVWLRASLPVLHARTSRSKHRPILQSGDAEAILADLIDKRYPIYAEADLVIDTETQLLDATAETVLKTLIEHKLVSQDVP